MKLHADHQLAFSITRHSRIDLCPSFLALVLLSQLSVAVVAQRKVTAARTRVEVRDEKVSLTGDAESFNNEAERLRREQLTESNYMAAEKFQQAAQRWQSAGELHLAAGALRNAGIVYQQLGESENALRAYKESLALSRMNRDVLQEGKVRNDLGYFYFIRGDSKAALENCSVALKLARVIRSQEVEAQAISNIAEAHYGLGDLARAVTYQEQALQLWEMLGNTHGQAQASVALGYYHMHSSEMAKASEFYQRALSLSRDANDIRSEAQALIAIGNLKSKLGDLQEALDSYDLARVRVQRIGDRIMQASVLGGISSIYSGLGEKGKALEYSEQALKLFEQSNEHWGMAEGLLDLGRIQYALGNTQKALYYFQQALQLFDSLSMSRLQAQTLRDIGLLESSLKDYQAALNSYQHALKLFRIGQDQLHEAYTLNYLGQVYHDLKDYKRAIAYYQQALALNGVASDPAGRVLSLFNIARAERDMGKLVEAMRSIEEACLIAESLRVSVLSQDLRASYFATVRQSYELYIDILMLRDAAEPNHGFAEQAFGISERERARSFLELLQESQADIQQGVNPELLAQQRSLEAGINSKAEQQLRLLAKSDKVEADKVGKEIAELNVQYSKLSDEIKATSPRYAELTSPQPLNLQQVQERILDNSTLLLEYALGDERSYVWAVSRTHISSYQLPARSEIEASAGRLYKIITAYQIIPGEPLDERLARQEMADRSITSETALLGKMVLGPVAGTLGNKSLVIIADGTLQYVPFGSLFDPDSPESSPRYLVQQHEVVNQPSASTLALLLSEAVEREPAPDSVAVLADPVFEIDDPRVRAGSRPGSPPPAGNLKLQQALRDIGISTDGVNIPRLLASGEEANAIVKVAPWGTALKAVGFDATRERVLGQDLTRYSIVHFATHGLINNEHPELSGIVLSLFDQEGNSHDGFLRLHDIYNMRLPADLVVLSACSTGLGKDVKGEGLIGLTRGFMYAGASGVVASLWKVDDEATSELMKRFYEAIFKKGMTPSAALRDAQLSMLKQKSWQSPYYWAGFVIQGRTNEKQNVRVWLFRTRDRVIGSVVGVVAFLAFVTWLIGRRRRII